MRISIAERLRPFSHVPGTSTILPGAGYQVQIFPCLIRIYHLKSSIPFLLTELVLDLKGPMEQFTVYNDLEKGRIAISGKTTEGWVRYHLTSRAEGEGVRLLMEKAPCNGVQIDEKGKLIILRSKEWLDLLLAPGMTFAPYQVPPCDRLSLGSHRAQDWQLIKRRFLFTEIFPLVHRLGQLIPPMRYFQSQEGTLTLLKECEQSCSFERPEKGEERWTHFLLGCFHEMLVPQLQDMNYQGLVKSQSLISLDISPLVILSQGAKLIRKLFIHQDNNRLLILPFLFPSLPCGRLLDISLDGGNLSLEWTKKTIRRLIFYPDRDQEWELRFRSDVKSYRLRKHMQEKGERKNCSDTLFLKKNSRYLFDNFQ